MTEARIFAEGSLRWAAASGTASTTGNTWQTASGAATGLIGYVQVGASFTQTRQVATVKDRGTPSHFKYMGKDAIQLKIKFLQSNSANYPPTATTGAGASIPMVLFELKHNRPELGAASAEYHQFLYCTILPQVWTEGDPGNAYDQTWNCIDMIGPASTGYLATGGQ